MPSPVSRGIRAFFTFIFFCIPFQHIAAQQASAPNADPTYQQLRNITLSGEAIGVSNLILKRDAGTFHLRAGTFCFLAPVLGRVTGAVFVGDGSLVLDPPLDAERHSLKLLTKESAFVETFNNMVLRFSDDTYDELKKAASGSSGSCDVKRLQDNLQTVRKTLRFNLTARILQDVLSPQPDGLFVAFIHGKHYSDKMIYAIDPHGVPQFAEEVYRDIPIALPLAPEEVALMTYEDNKHCYWAAFHFAAEYKNGLATGAQKNGFIHIEHQTLDTTIEKSGNIIGKATTTLVSQVDGLRVVPFDLFHRLRVQNVTADGGAALSFIQEDKNEDYQFSVILPKPLALGEKFTLTSTYSGKEAVVNAGGDNFFPVARENWYPNNAAGGLGEYTTYDLTFRIPKGMRMIATGDLVKEGNEGGQNVSIWKSEGPQTVAGFNFGRFRVQEVQLAKPAYVIQSAANEEPPDWVRSLKQATEGDTLQGINASHLGAEVALGNMSTTPLIKKALAEGQLAVDLYSNYFGPSSFKRVAITQQSSCSFGQSWPELVYIPMCYFFDTTIRHGLGMDWGDRGYWKIVTPHEVAHQWWGHTIGFNSYRDQWMSEGFAEMSASLYLHD